MAITLSNDDTSKALASIRRYFAEQMDQDVGELQARLLLDFFLGEIAPAVYNAAIGDAQTYMRDRVADLEDVCFVPPFEYWPRDAAVTRRARPDDKKGRRS